MNTHELSGPQQASRYRTSLPFVAVPAYTLLVLAVIWLYVEVGWFRAPAELLNVSTIDTRVRRIDSELSVVGALARNADMHTHTHGWSDARLKQDIYPIANPLSNVLQVHGIRFSWHQDSEREFPQGPQIGILAQELEAVFPELVARDENGFMSVDYARLTPILLEAIREQQAQIAELQQEIKVLDERVRVLEGSTDSHRKIGQYGSPSWADQVIRTR